MWELIKENLKIVIKNPMWIPVLLLYALFWIPSQIYRWIRGSR